MNRQQENDCFRRFQATRDPRLLAQVFDATAPELVRVAGHLANGDRELTHDALQATFLTAIEDADRYDPARALRPWLLGILANHVRKERRRALQARGSDPAALVLAAADSPIEAVQHAEFGSAAGEAMQQLPSPFREALVLHLQHGLTAAEIGDALGRPAGTVRTQIVRGMDRLRALLPVGFAAAALGVLSTPGALLASVRSELLAALPTSLKVGSSSLALSGWRLYAMIAAGVTVLLSLAASFLSGADPSPPAPPPSAGRVAVLPTAGSDDPALLRESVLAPTPLLLPAGAIVVPVPQAQAGGDVPVVFEVVHADGTAAADVPIGVRLHGHLQQWRTDAAGRLGIELPWPGDYEAYVLGTDARAVISWPEFTDRPSDEKVSMKIEPGMSLEVRVVDANGKPVAGALVEATHGVQPSGMFNQLGRTDAGGRFVRRDVAVRGQVRAWANGHLPSTIEDAFGKPGDTREVLLRLPGKGLTATGIVRDEHGDPVANARLALVQLQRRTLFPQFLNSAADGTFVLDSLHAGRHALVGVHVADELRRGELRFEHDGTTTPQLELRLTKGASIEGRLTDAMGNGIPGVNLVARDRPDAVHQLPFLATWTKSDADGTFALTGLVAGRYLLESDNVPSLAIDVRAGEARTWNPVQAALKPISVRLLDAMGRPLVGWQVCLIEPGGVYPRHNGLTGEDGRLRDAKYLAWNYPQGSFCRFAVFRKLGKRDEWFDFGPWPNLITPPLAVGMQHEIRVPAHAFAMHEVVGTVVDQHGIAVAGAKVVMRSVVGSAWQRDAAVDAETGSFAFADVAPGRYRAVVRMAGRPPLRLPPIEARGGGVVSIGPVQVPDLARIVARRAGGGDAAAGLRLQLVAVDGTAWPLRKVDGEHAWRSVRVYHGEYELRGWTESARVVPQSVVVDGGQQRIEFSLAAHAATRVTVQLSPAHPRNNSVWQGTLVAGQGRDAVEHELERSFGGVFQDRMEFLLPLPPGRHKLRIKGWHGHVGEAVVEVPSVGGGEVVVDVQ